MYSDSKEKYNSYPYPCVLAVMAHKTLSCGLNSRKGGYIFFYIMFKNTNQNVQTFNNSQFGDLRVNLSNDGKIWFCLSDVCVSLGLGNASQTKSRLKQEGITTNDTPTRSGQQQMLFIDEPNLYRCIFQSRKQEAEAFQDWVFEEVLPSIRKHGAYATETTIDSIIANPENGIKLLQALQKEREEKRQLEARAEQQQATIELQANEIKTAAPKVQYVDNVLQSVNTYTVQQIAKELDTTANRLYAFLKEKRVMFRQSGIWMLTAKYNGKGYTKMRTHQFTRNDGSVGTSSYTVFTEKGRALIHGMMPERKEAVAL